MEEQVCAFSGHRPEKLPWGVDETDPRCAALKVLMGRQLRQLWESGCHTFLCGMARGADQYYLEALLALREDCPLTIEAAVPCLTQADRWPPEDRRRYLRNLAACDRMTVVEDTYSQGCMLRRNRYMIEHATILMTVFDGSPGGTAAAVHYARSRGVRLLPLWK